MGYTNAQLKEMYKKLPAKVREAIFSDQTSDTMQAIGSTYQLHVDQVGIVADEAGLVMLGVKPQKKLSAAIETRAHLPKEVAARVAADVDAKIFKPIQDLLKGDMDREENVVTLPSYEEERKKTQTPTPVLESTPPTAPPATPTVENVPAVPVSTPPIAATPELQENPVFAETATPPTAPPAQNIIGSKLGGVTYGNESKKTEPPAKSAVDPYREPIE